MKGRGRAKLLSPSASNRRRVGALIRAASGELRGRLGAREYAVADPDKDGTLSKDEYLAIVEQRFKAADSDNDGTLTAKELNSRAGRSLLRLLQ